MSPQSQPKNLTPPNPKARGTQDPFAGSTAHFLSVFRSLLEANVSYCLLGDDSRYRELLKGELEPECLKDFKEYLGVDSMDIGGRTRQKHTKRDPKDLKIAVFPNYCNWIVTMLDGVSLGKTDCIFANDRTSQEIRDKSEVFLMFLVTYPSCLVKILDPHVFWTREIPKGIGTEDSFGC